MSIDEEVKTEQVDVTFKEPEKTQTKISIKGLMYYQH